MSGHAIIVIQVIKNFLYNYSLCSYHLFLISSAFVRSVPFLSFIMLIFALNVPLVSLIFLKRSQVFPILLFSCFFALIAEEGFRISPCYSLEPCIQMGISFLFSFAPNFSSILYLTRLFLRPRQTTILPFCIPFLGDGLDPCLLYNVTNLCP